MAIVILSGCGGEKKPGKSADKTAKPRAAEQTTATETETTAGATQSSSAGQLDFYTERYISGKERLMRRQNRIQQELSGGNNGAG